MTEPLRVPEKESEYLARRGRKSRKGVPFQYEGSEVEHLQEALLILGYDLPEFGVDGLFLFETEAAVEEFQADHNDLFVIDGGECPPLKVDGIVGPKTALALNCALARSGIWFDKFEYEWTDEEEETNRVCCIRGLKTSINPSRGENVRLHIERVLEGEIRAKDAFATIHWEEETPGFESQV